MSNIKKTEEQFEKVMNLLDDFTNDKNTSTADLKKVKAELAKTVEQLETKIAEKQPI